MVTVGYREDNLEQLTDFFEFSPVGMFIVDGRGVVARANLATLEVLGCFGAADRFVGRRFSDRFTDPDLARRLIAEVADGKPVLHVAAQLAVAGGPPVEVLLDGNARLEGSQLRSTRWFLRPAALKRELPTAKAVDASPSADEALARMTADAKAAAFDELNDFFDNAPIGVHFVGLNGIMLRANRAEVSLLGYEDRPDGYIGRHVRELHHEPAVVETLLERLVSGIPVIAHEAYMKKQDGTVQPVYIYSGFRLKAGKFQNTRCFLFKNPSPRKPPSESHVPDFSWPR